MRIVKQLPNKGSGIISHVSLDDQLRFSPKVYSKSWKKLLNGKGRYVLILGTGTGNAEVFQAFDYAKKYRIKISSPKIMCYDIAKVVPEDFKKLQKLHPLADAKYLTNNDLGKVSFPKEYIGNTRLVSMHGSLDYITPERIGRLLTKVIALKPEAISIRLCLLNQEWSSQFTTEKELKTELASIDNMLKGKYKTMNVDMLVKNGIVTLMILKDKLIEHNLLGTYPASHIMPDMLAGYIQSCGYKITTEAFSSSKIRRYTSAMIFAERV